MFVSAFFKVVVASTDPQTPDFFYENQGIAVLNLAVRRDPNPHRYGNLLHPVQNLHNDCLGPILLKNSTTCLGACWETWFTST